MCNAGLSSYGLKPFVSEEKTEVKAVRVLRKIPIIMWEEGRELKEEAGVKNRKKERKTERKNPKTYVKTIQVSHQEDEH